MSDSVEYPPGGFVASLFFFRFVVRLQTRQQVDGLNLFFLVDMRVDFHCQRDVGVPCQRLCHLGRNQ